MADLQQIIEIRDPEINVEEIMDRIRSRIRQRREQAARHGHDYDKLVDENLSDISGRLPADFYYELNQLCANAEAIGVSLAMRDRRFPVLNPLLFRIENLLHRLVVKYVNMMAGRQIAMNRSAAHVLSGLTRAFEERELRIQNLEKQVSDLRAQIVNSEPH